MNIKQIREKKIEELVKMRDELHTKYADECFEMRMGKLKDMKQPRKTRKDLARVQIVIGEKGKEKRVKLVKNDDKQEKVKLSKKTKDVKAKV